MDLIKALLELANQYDLDAGRLIGFAQEDTIGGFHKDESLRTYNTGAIWGVEGQVLYALIRYIEPDRVADIGTGTGCALHHMAAAMFKNGHGMVYTIDNNAGEEHQFRDNQRTEHLRSHIHYVNEDAVSWLSEQGDNAFDLIFEDWTHDAAMISEVWRLATRKLRSGGFVISHDSEHFLVGAQVLEGVVNAHVPQFGILRQLIEPSDCGMVIWQRDFGNVHRLEVTREVLSDDELLTERYERERENRTFDEASEVYDLEPIPEENQLPEFDAEIEQEGDPYASDIIDYEAELTDEDVHELEIFEIVQDARLRAEPAPSQIKEERRAELESETKAQLLNDYDSDEYGLKSSMSKGEIVDTILDKWSEWNEDNEPE